MLQWRQSLHLDKYLEQQNTKKPQETKSNCIHAPLGQIMGKNITKSLKIQLLLLKSRESKRKSRVLGRSPITTPPKGWADHLNHPSAPLEPSPPLPYKRNQLAPPCEPGSKGTHCLFLLPPAAAGAPVKPCLNFVWPLINFN